MSSSHRSENNRELPLCGNFASHGELNLYVRQPTPAVAVVEVVGDVDLSTAAHLEHAVESRLLSTVGVVVVNLSRCTFLSVAGLRVLCRLELLAGQLEVDFSVDPGGSRAALRLLQIVPIGCECPGRAKAFDESDPQAAHDAIRGHERRQS